MSFPSFQKPTGIVELIDETKTLMLHLDDGDYVYERLAISKGNCSGIQGLTKGKFFGKGAVGKAYEATVANMGKRIFIVKESPLKLEHRKGEKSKVFEALKYHRIKEEYFYAFQDNAEQIRDAKDNEIIRYTEPPLRCDSDENAYYKPIPSNPPHKNIFVPSKSFVCYNESMYESILNSFTSNIYRNGICANFINVYAMYTCSSKSLPRTFYQTILMDKQNGKDLAKAAPCISKDLFHDLRPEAQEMAMDSVYVQTLFAIHCYQHTFRISHNDLHYGNVFIEYVTDETVFQNQSINDADWYHYRIGTDNIYVPAVGIIPKIGDFGKSVMYGIPDTDSAIIGDMQVIVDGYSGSNEITKPWMTNIFHPSYDLLYFTNSVMMQLGGGQIDSYKISPLIVECLKHMLKINDVNRYIYQTLANKFIQSENARPVLEELHNIRGPREVLLGPILRKYGIKPVIGKIVTLGQIN